MVSIQLSHVSKIYKGKKRGENVNAVTDFNLESQKKEFIVFVGPSGCGKSTTLRMIAGLEDITSGDFFIDGERMNDVEAQDRNIAMVFQNYALYPHMTAYQNMAFGLKNRKVPKEDIDARIKAAAKILDIEPLLNRKPKAMSGGQRQRVALGRALVRTPKLFLLDEPLSNLDAKLRSQMRVEISKLYEKLDTTFIYVTHDQIEAMTMGTRIVVMRDGVIQQQGDPTFIYDYPANRFVAGFLGTPQMNFFEATLTSKASRVSLLLKDGQTISFALKKRKLQPTYADGKPHSVILGIRPEHLSVDPKGPLKAKVSLSEILGSETLLYCTLPIKDDSQGPQDEAVVKIPSRYVVKNGEALNLQFVPDQIHLFDGESEVAILSDAHGKFLQAPSIINRIKQVKDTPVSK